MNFVKTFYSFNKHTISIAGNLLFSGILIALFRKDLYMEREHKQMTKFLKLAT